MNSTLPSYQPYPLSQLSCFSEIRGYLPDHPVWIEGSPGALETLQSLPEKGLAVVGTRYPQRRSFEHIEKVFEQIRNTDLIIVSGLARGIDAKAHELALQHGLKTIAVLGCGIDLDYPASNHHLRRSIVEAGGLVITPFAPGTPALGHHFLERNQWVAGLAKATWVVEAAAISGTLNTAQWAMKLNRSLYATSCYPGDPFLQGNEKLLSQKQPHLYPVAEALFCANSLLSTWPELKLEPHQQLALDLPDTSQPLLREITRAANQNGFCTVSSLMTWARNHSKSSQELYQELQALLNQGKIEQQEAGNLKPVLSKMV